MIRARLRELGIADADELTIDTVECYQGSQRDYILFTTTISQPYQLDILSSPQLVEGVSIDRKLNVAITRARKQFFLVGNKQILTASPIYQALIAACDEMPCATHAATNNID
jgi:superfamily I DNA and/or RNA helicase